MARRPSFPVVPVTATFIAAVAAVEANNNNRAATMAVSYIWAGRHHSPPDEKNHGATRDSSVRPRRRIERSVRIIACIW